MYTTITELLGDGRVVRAFVRDDHANIVDNLDVFPDFPQSLGACHIGLLPQRVSVVFIDAQKEEPRVRIQGS